jgi:WD40 repeat protein
MDLRRTVCQQPWRRTTNWFTPWTRGVLVGLMALGIYSGDGLLAADEPSKGLPSVQIEPLPKGIVFAVVFSKDGRQIALACEDKTVAVHDAKTGKEVVRLEGHSERVWTAAFSPDGATLASCSGEYARPEDGGAVKVWDLKTGKEKASLEGHRGLVFHVTFSPDGKTLLSAGWDGTVRLWDVATNKEKTILKDHTGPVRTIVFTPDGKSFATASFDGTVRFWDAATAKHQKTLKAHTTGVQCVAFSPCGKYLATSARPTGGERDPEISLWDLASDKEPARITGLRGHILSLDFSPDGKMLACGGGSFGQYGEVKLFEVASGRERAEFKDHKEWVECVKFSPDGGILVSAGGFSRGVPGQIRVHALTDLREKKPSAPADISTEQLQALWDALAEKDAAKAHQAILALTASPRVTVPFLKNRMKPTAPVDSKRVARLVEKLDDDSFEERERVTKELEALLDLACPALRKALAQGPSEEVRTRVTRLLAQVEIPISAPELLRVLRAIEVLEHLGTPEARELLEALAGGAAEARPTWEAKASLKRLAK